MKRSIAAVILVSLSILSTVPAFSRTELSSASQLARNKETARLWYEDVVVKKDLKVIDSILAKDAIQELAPSFISPVHGTNKFSGLENIKQHMAKIHTLGQYEMANPIIVAEGNRAAVLREVTENMTTGQKAVIPWVTFFEFDKDGKISHMIHVHDTLHQKNQFDKTAPKGK